MAMAMFTSERSHELVPDNVRAPLMKLWGFEAKKEPESSPELRPEHYHGDRGHYQCFLRP